MNAEQQEIFDVVKDGKNVLMLGMGGVGKSFTLHEIIQWANGRRIVSGVTATTGSAAILIQGTTLHSFLGIGLGTKTPVELADLVKTKKRFVYNRLRRLELLAIDEISMLDANLFDLISIFLGIVRDRQNVPFGGLQLILCGDLFQLPPVHGKFFFKSEVWPTMDIKIIELKESQRHKDDIEFMNILSELRQGKCTLEILKILKNTKHNVFPEDILPTLLYSKNMDVDSLNESKYNELIKTGARSFEYKLTYSSDVGKMWAQSCKIPESVKMCVGACSL